MKNFEIINFEMSLYEGETPKSIEETISPMQAVATVISPRELFDLCAQVLDAEDWRFWDEAFALEQELEFDLWGSEDDDEDYGPAEEDLCGGCWYDERLY